MARRWLLTEEEDAKLQGITTDAMAIYVRVIRRYMDFSTGMSAVTYGQMKQALEYIPDRGSRLPARRVADVSNHFVRARLAELERQGLIEIIKTKSRFDPPAFRCLLAALGSLRPNEEPQMNRKDGTASGTANESPGNTSGYEQGAPRGTANEPQGMNRKISGIPVGSTNNLLPNITFGTTYQHARDGDGGPTPAGAMAVALRGAGIDVTSMHPTLLAWVNDDFTPEQLLEAVELARVHKPAPQRIPANYLDRVLRNQAQAQSISGGNPYEARQPIDNSAVARVRRANSPPEPGQPGERVIEGQFRRT